MLPHLSPTLTGALYALAAALAFALWNIYLQRGLAHGGGPRLALLTVALSEVACFVPLSLWLAGHGHLPPLDGRGLLWFVVAGVLTSVIGTYLATQATRRIGAVQTTALRLLDPFFALLIAAAFLGERLGARALGGMALLVLALLLLQQRAVAAPSARRQHAGGLLYAVLASFAFTLGSVARKAGLLLVPAALVAGAIEGLAGVLVVGLVLGLQGDGRALAALRSAASRDLWWSGLAAAAGTLCLNLALQRLAVPLAVALRNTSPWFALVLIPPLLGRRQRAGRWIWVSTGLLTAGMLLIVLR